MPLRQRDIDRVQRWLRQSGLDKRLGKWLLPTAIIGAVVVGAIQLWWQDDGERLVRSGDIQHCSVTRVYDGDTVTLNCQRRSVKVRIWGIDAPEIGQAPWGEQARKALADRIGNTVELLPKETDRYGRTVGQLFDGNSDIGLSLVEDGYVRRYAQYNDSARYARAENQARQAGRGIWQASGAHQTPWEWRRQQ